MVTVPIVVGDQRVCCRENRVVHLQSMHVKELCILLYYQRTRLVPISIILLVAFVLKRSVEVWREQKACAFYQKA